MHLTRQPIKAGDNQNSAALATGGEGKGQLRAAVPLAAFYLA
jgi:hypothetical protein